MEIDYVIVSNSLGVKGPELHPIFHFLQVKPRLLLTSTRPPKDRRTGAHFRAESSGLRALGPVHLMAERHEQRSDGSQKDHERRSVNLILKCSPQQLTILVAQSRPLNQWMVGIPRIRLQTARYKPWTAWCNTAYSWVHFSFRASGPMEYCHQRTSPKSSADSDHEVAAPCPTPPNHAESIAAAVWEERQRTSSKSQHTSSKPVTRSNTSSS